MAKKAKKKLKPVIKSDEPVLPTPPPLEELGEAELPKESVLSETPVVGGEQSTAPVRNDEQGTPPTLPHEAMTSDIQTISIPEVKKEPEPIEPAHPVICAGCKATVDSSTTRACINPKCPRGLVFCPACAKADTCHKCGKALSK